MSAWRVFATRKTGIFRDLVLSRALRAYIDAMAWMRAANSGYTAGFTTRT